MTFRVFLLFDFSRKNLVQDRVFGLREEVFGGIWWNNLECDMHVLVSAN